MHEPARDGAHEEGEEEGKDDDGHDGSDRPDDPAERIQWILRESNAAFTLTDDALRFPEEAGAADGSIYRYDRAGLLVALKSGSGRG